MCIRDRKTAKKLAKLWSHPVRMVSFNIPALLACPFADACIKFCYALMGRFAMRDAQKVRAGNLAMLRELYNRGGVDLVAQTIANSLWPDMRRSLKKGQRLVIRVHDSGDFFSLWYAQAWADAYRLICARWVAEGGSADMLPLPYAYTKALKHFAAVDFGFPVTQSVGGIADGAIDYTESHSVVFGTVEECEAAGYVNGTDSDIPAILGETKIGLIYHGNEAKVEDVREHLRSAPRALPMAA